MKKVFLLIFCFSGIITFAQNGFFLQPEGGAGISNTCWQAFSPMGYPNQRSVFSYQGQVDIGYKARKWQFITGIGYMRTGVNITSGFIGKFRNENQLLSNIVELPDNITDYNPHIILPVKIGYEVIRFSDKLSFTPFVGAVLAYNMPRTFFITQKNYLPNYSSPTRKVTESQQQFNAYCNQYGVMGLVQLNFEYHLNERFGITSGPSVDYMFTSMLNRSSEYDYAVLMNLGLKWNFKHKKNPAK